MKQITEIAERAGIKEEEIESFGKYKAKVSLGIWERISAKPDGKLILVTTINPTIQGEGKTTVAIGLAQALARLGKSVMVGLREPSIGPCMGKKGGATGGGQAQVLPSEDINLYFTGDIPSIAAAHNLLSALLNNHIHHGNSLNIEQRRICWHRVIDVNDRALRHIVIGLGGENNGVLQEDRFEITSASEVMAIVSLAQNIKALKEMLSRIIVGYTFDGKPITATDLKAVGAMALLLRDAIKPNLVQTTEGIPAFVHCGPFANIGHGCSSIVSTKFGLKLADYFVTEAGFGTELGAEKFFDIVCRMAAFKPNIAVLVVSVKGLKAHGSWARELRKEMSGEELLKAGFPNLAKHLSNLQLFGVPVVVGINVFPGDRNEEIEMIRKMCANIDVPVAVLDVYGRGGEGGIKLALEVLNSLEKGKGSFRYLYNINSRIKEKIETIATIMYGARRVVYTIEAEK
ncbi:MAG: formate--tetrahydrofolate ligase, partial [Candidatus Thermoplasmatota archaeon]